MRPPEGYRHATELTVRFADLDAMGHLNHAKYLTYMEQARILYMQDVCGFNGIWADLSIILASVTCDYLMPVAFAETITVYTRCSRIGGKSFDLEYALLNEQDDTVAIGKTVMVAFDYESNQTMPIPDVWRDWMTGYDGL